MGRTLGIFVDESGDQEGISRYYVVTLVIHDQTHPIDVFVSNYERYIAISDLPNVPFHSEPLLNGHSGYENLPISQRKKLLSSFATLVRHLPIRYKTFVYKRKEFETAEKLSVKIGQDVAEFLRNNFEYFSTFDEVKVYYDNGQDIVKRALDESLNFVLSAGVVKRRKTSMTDYRLEQVADYLCTIELAAVKYEAHENGATYNKFFGGVGTFKKNWLKQARRKAL